MRLEPAIGAQELEEEDIDAIVAFLETLTDQRVVMQSAPFDHPELTVPVGHAGDEKYVEADGDQAVTEFIVIPAVGHAGGPLAVGFLE